MSWFFFPWIPHYLSSTSPLRLFNQTSEKASYFPASTLPHFPFYPIGSPHSSHSDSFFQNTNWIMMFLPLHKTLQLFPNVLRLKSWLKVYHNLSGPYLTPEVAPLSPLLMEPGGTGFRALPRLFISAWCVPRSNFHSTGSSYHMDLPSVKSSQPVSSSTKVLSFTSLPFNIFLCMNATWFCLLFVCIFLYICIFFLLWEETSSIRGVTFSILVTVIFPEPRPVLAIC